MKRDSLGDRCKEYETRARHNFIPKVPIVIRVDGKAFHTWARGATKPFDSAIINSMITAAVSAAKEMQGCVCVYTQSDEASFVLCDDASPETQAWFGGRQNKIESVASSLMTAHFNAWWKEFNKPLAFFDARAYQVPKEDVANVLLWRVKDCERNSINSYCESFFSPAELHGKSIAQRHAMLARIGKFWVRDCTDAERHGTWWSPNRGHSCNLLTYADINSYCFS